MGTKREAPKKRRRTGHQRTRKPAATPTSGATAAATRPLAQEAILQMQHQHGNAFVQRRLARHSASQKPPAVQRTSGSIFIPLIVQSAWFQVLLHRAKIKQLKTDLAAASTESKPDILEQIYNHEQELATALPNYLNNLNNHLASLNKRKESLAEPDPEIEKMIAYTQKEIGKATKELQVVERVSSAQKAAAFAEKYKKEVKPLPGGGCMTAVYQGLEVLHSEKESKSLRKEVYKDAKKILDKTGKDTNHMTRIINTLHAHGKAGAEIKLEYKRRKKTWEPDPEKTILGMVSTDLPGWYFFAVSLHGAYHSVILAVDTTSGSPQIYWMDQYAKGFTKNITGKVVEEFKNWKPSYGFAATRIRPILPTAETVIEIE